MSAYKSKRRKALTPIHAQTKGKALTLKEAIQTLRQGPKTKFDQSLEIQFKLGVDLAANDQVVRGTTVLPHGQGKKLRVIVFCKDENAKAAKEAGAVEVGAEDLIEKVPATADQHSHQRCMLKGGRRLSSAA